MNAILHLVQILIFSINHHFYPNGIYEIDILQPYDGIVHNGVIANDKHFSDEVIDSIVLPKVLNPRDDINSLYENIQKIEGSYAIAYFNDKLRPLSDLVY